MALLGQQEGPGGSWESSQGEEGARGVMDGDKVKVDPEEGADNNIEPIQL